MIKAKILIVEDEIIIARALRKEIEDLGYEVCPLSSSGEEAFEIAENEKPDLVIMDIHIQGTMDGVEAARQIKDRFGIPAIFATGYSEDEIKEKAEVTESYQYLIKPFGKNNIKSSIELSLQNHNP
jgi:CheY-like chemotaxis protein